MKNVFSFCLFSQPAFFQHKYATPHNYWNILIFLQMVHLTIYKQKQKLNNNSNNN